MKIAIVCESELLQKSLEIYLKEYLSSLSDCDFVISDYNASDLKPLCLVGNGQNAHIKKPFTQLSLLKDIYDFYETFFLTSDSKLQGLSKQDIFVYQQISALVECTFNEFNQKLYEILKLKNNIQNDA
ncbi:hypothetical protein [Helicobacter fennelliae]|nr:hypothetical protein [Helicobacter fennelliae]SQB98993.1 Dihydroneopterin aldolase [Helicobacter fennelliae]STP08274.1 Dihydroneopterin aldolase [Helicobacter fennelliae]STQ84687.1 Dihydroneopterin aldolase [Helicobacter fennelliae]